MNFGNFLILLLAIFSFIQITTTYKYVKIQNNNICPAKIVSKVLTIFKGKRLSLGERKESAMLIEQTWDNKTLTYLENSCKFVVHTNDKAPGSGLYTVINKLNFRKQNETCIDYLIFSGGNRPRSKPICERIGVKTGKNEKESLIFNEHDHEVEIQLFINKDISITEPLELSIVVTQHMNCYSGRFQCDVNDSFSCIYSDFENDGVPNCLPPCADEDGGCFQNAVTSEPLVPAISALTSMIFTMIGVGGCVWVCWKYWDCVKATRIQNAENRRTRNVPNMVSCFFTLQLTSFQTGVKVNFKFRLYFICCVFAIINDVYYSKICVFP
ncbi:hypothetical protein ACFFRR_009432 [Megaselia abdita]